MLKMPLWMAFLLIVGVGAILLGLSSFAAIEGFIAGGPGIRCGTDLPECGGATDCINGFCRLKNPPVLPPNEIPTYP
jgi:hypothetical protein